MKREDTITPKNQPLRANGPVGMMTERPNASALIRKAMTQQQREDRARRQLLGKPSWQKWKVIPEVSKHEAIALSLGVEPTERNLEALWHDIEFRERLEIVERNSSAGDLHFARRLRDGRYLTATPMVLFREFAKWAQEKDMQVPIELKNLAGQPSYTELKEEIKRLQAEIDQSWKFDNKGSTHPPELDMALQAWRAVSNDQSKSSKTAHQRLQAWLTETYPQLTDGTKERIATVANWDKQRGRKSNKTK